MTLLRPSRVGRLFQCLPLHPKMWSLLLSQMESLSIDPRADRLQRSLLPYVPPVGESYVNRAGEKGAGMDEVERVARAICQSRGKDPDHRDKWLSRIMVDGRLQILSDGRAGEDRRHYEEQKVVGPAAWEDYKIDAIAAIKAIREV